MYKRLVNSFFCPPKGKIWKQNVLLTALNADVGFLCSMFFPLNPLCIFIYFLNQQVEHFSSVFLFCVLLSVAFMWPSDSSGLSGATKGTSDLWRRTEVE